MGFFDKQAIKKYMKEAEKVIAYESTMAGLSDDELRAKTPYFKELLANGKTLDDIKYEAFAVAREAAKRTLNEFPYKVQIIGSLVLHNGDIAEMKTGEGKTLTCTMAVYLNALAGKGVHVVTVNEYLSTRDAEWMGQVYRFLGLTVGVNMRAKTTSEKREAYLCDITYTTNSELGFDYLRDNMATSMGGRVLRGLNFCIVDEADSILIDESRTPLIISGGAKASASQYTVADRFVKTLKKEVDFVVDIKEKTVNLTDDGNKKAERMFGITNLYNPEYSDLVHRIFNALKANYIMGRDVDYLVDAEGQVQIIDQFTGRVLPGREWSDGLHQAVQAKENVEIKQETVTMATITYQNFFRLFKKMSGMTGTAKTEEEEFRKIYNMRVVCIPTNRPVIRIDALDYVYAHKAAKLAALVKEVKERHEKGQPILIGTVSVESSEEISELLTKEGLQHEMLNAKNHAREAEVIALAGRKGAITLATNMAGRGTDIKIDDEVRALGGLCVFGTERHESRRIDNQLRGRSGRQGDPGVTQFYLSLEDDLMRLFAGEAVHLRKFDFEKKDGYDAAQETTLPPRGIVVIEGIHALNPLLTAGIPDELKFRVYLNVFTFPTVEGDWAFFADDIRLIRRIVRDANYRNESAAMTLERWPSVADGEQKWINPYRGLADAVFNTGLDYELAVLKPYASELLCGVDGPCAAEAERLQSVLATVKEAPSEGIPGNSILRETIGGSQLEY